MRIPLHRFVDDLTEGLLPLAVNRKSLLINQIDRDLEIEADENMLAYVLYNLLDRVVNSTENKCIHIESVSTGNSTVIRVRNAGVYFYRCVSNGFRQMQHAAEKLGGNISIDYTNHTSPTVELILEESLQAV